MTELLTVQPQQLLLLDDERDELAHCEQIIEHGLQTFIDVGHALKQIRDSRLYRATHERFEDYCRERWRLSRPRAYELIGAADVADDVSAIADTSSIPESHLRPLTRLDDAEARRDALLRATELAGDAPRTARHVQQAVDEQTHHTCTSCGASVLVRRLTLYGPDTIAAYPEGAKLCDDCVQQLLRAAVETQQELHTCACGKQATSKRTIGGLSEWRCDNCMRDAEQRAELELLDANADMRTLIEHAEQLGAVVDVTAYDDVRYVRVTAPPGYQQQSVKCDASDLRTLVDAWEGHSLQADAWETAPQPPASQQLHAQLIRIWHSVERALDDGYKAVALKHARELVAVLEQQVQS